MNQTDVSSSQPPEPPEQRLDFVSTNKTRSALPTNVRLLGWVSFWNDIAGEMVFPLLPNFLLVILGGNRFYLGIIEGLAESTASMLKLWSGTYSDRSNSRKPFIVFGYSLASICRPMTAILSAPWQLLVIRMLDRVGKGIRSAPRDALVVDSTSPELRGRAFGFQRSMDHLGAAIGPVLATVFLLFFPDQIRWLFALTVLPGLAVVCLLVFGLSERKRVEATVVTTLLPSPTKTSEKADNRFSPGLRWYLLAILLFTLGNSTDAFLLVRATELGIAQVWIPLLWCTFQLIKSGLTVVAGHAVDRYGPKRLLTFGWLIYILVYSGFAFANQLWHVLTLMVVYAIYYALAEPSERALVAQLCSPNHRGRAFGWFNFTIGIAALPANLMFGWLYQDYGSIAAFGFGGLMALCATVLLGYVQADATLIPTKKSTS